MFNLKTQNMPTTEDLLAQLKAAQEEAAQLQQQLAQKSPSRPKSSSKVKSVGNTLYIPHSMTGEALKSKSEYDETQILEFRKKNLLKRAKELRDTAAWNISEAEKLENMAEDTQKDIDTIKMLQ